MEMRSQRAGAYRRGEARGSFTLRWARRPDPGKCRRWLC